MSQDASAINSSPSDVAQQAAVDENKPLMQSPYEAAQQQRAAGATPAEPEPQGPVITRSMRKGDPMNMNATKLSKRHYLLLTEMLFLSLSTMYVEMCIVPALPTIMATWPDSTSFVPWVISAYNIAGAVWTPIAGSLADIYGPKWVAIGSLCMYMCGQVGCALSPNLWCLICFRACQGFGMAIFVLCFAIIKLTFPVKIVPVAIGTISAMFSVGMCIGLVGGAISIQEMPKWQDVFWTTFPVIAIIAIAFAFTMPSYRGSSKRRPDFIGAVLIAAGVIVFLLGMTLSSTWGWTNWKTLLLVIGGVALLGVFVKAELMIRDPLVSIRLLIKRNLAAAATIAFLIGFCLFALFQVSPFLIKSPFTSILPDDKKREPVWMGIVLLPFGITQFFTAPLSGIAGRKTGFGLLAVISMAILTACFFVGVPWHYTLWQNELLTTVLGAVIGVIMVAIMNIVSESCTKEQFGSASGTNTLFRIFGGAVGPVCVNLLMMNDHKYDYPDATSSSSGAPESIPDDGGYKRAYLLMGAFSAAGTIAALCVSNLNKACKKPQDEEKRSLLRSKGASSSGIHTSSSGN